MSVRIVRLGSPRLPGEGLRLGTVRRLPRGVRKAEYSTRDYFDVWLPDVAPSTGLLQWAQRQDGTWTERSWSTFERRYRREMQAPASQRWLAVLSALSVTSHFSVGCYCAEESRCHRRILRALLVEAGARLEAA